MFWRVSRMSVSLPRPGAGGYFAGGWCSNRMRAFYTPAQTEQRFIAAGQDGQAQAYGDGIQCVIGLAGEMHKAGQFARAFGFDFFHGAAFGVEVADLAVARAFGFNAHAADGIDGGR